MDACDLEVLDDDCHHFHAVSPDIREGFDGGKSDQQLDRNGNPD